MELKATQLRGNLYALLDHVLETGEALEIVRKGRRLQVVPAETPGYFSLGALEPHPDAIAGDADDLIDVDWSSEWRPFG